MILKKQLPPSVQVPDSVRALIPSYIEKRRKDLAVMKLALLQREFHVLARMGHGLKGSGGAYGFAGLSVIGQDLEEAALKSDSRALMFVIDQLEQELEKI